ncbi:MAG: HlyD family efflux transporter periplasmic adaptor subunit [Planctomycetaceae bacterium]
MRILVNAIGAILILTVGVGGFVMFGQKPDVPKNTGEKSGEGIPVRTAGVTAWNEPLILDVDGEAVTFRVITVGAEVGGRVVEKSEASRTGTIVSEGDLLFRIDDLNYRLDVQRLSAERQKAEEDVNMIAVDLENNASMIELAKEEWQLQKNQLERIRTAFERKATTESELDTAQRQELAARNALQTLQNQTRTLTQERKSKHASLELAAAQLKRAEADLARCIVSAPITGRIVDDLVEEGDYVTSGSDLVHISDSSRMEVQCSLQANEVKWILQQAGDEVSPESLLQIPNVRCEVTYDLDGVEAVWDGVLSRWGGSGLDRDTRTFPCRVLVENPRDVRLSDTAGGRPVVTPPALVSGMFVTVRIPVTSPVPLLQIPVEAVRPGGHVWAVRDGLLEILSVSVAETIGDVAVVRSADTGLQPGDRVIVSPLASVANGMAVSENDADAATPAAETSEHVTAESHKPIEDSAPQSSDQDNDRPDASGQ